MFDLDLNGECADPADSLNVKSNRIANLVESPGIGVGGLIQCGNLYSHFCQPIVTNQMAEHSSLGIMEILK